MIIKSRVEEGLGIRFELVNIDGMLKIIGKKINNNGKNIFSLPLTAHIAYTDSCNLRCKYCYAVSEKSERKHKNSYADFVRIIDELNNKNCMILSWSGGEPFFEDTFIDIIEYAGKKGFIQTVLTNAHLISKKHISILKKYNISLQISLNEVFEANNNVGLVSLDIAQNLIEQGLDVSVDIILGEEYVNLDSIIEKCINKGITKVKCGPLIAVGLCKNSINLDNYKATLKRFMLNIQEVRKKHSGKISIITQFDKKIYNDKTFSKRFKLCEAANHEMFIDYNGDVYPCPLLKDRNEFFAGNILTNSMSDIWMSNGMNLIRNIEIENTKCGKCEFLCGVWCRGLVLSYTDNITSDSPFCDLTMEVVRDKI